MKVVSNVKWQSGNTLLDSPPKHRSTAILAIKDNEKGNYFILPEIFTFDAKVKNFVGEEHGMPLNMDYWYMMEHELLSPFHSLVPLKPNNQNYAVDSVPVDSPMLNA